MDRIVVRWMGPLCYLLWSAIVSTPLFFLPDSLRLSVFVPFLVSFIYFSRALARKESVFGIEVALESEPILKNLVEITATQLGVKSPDFIVLGHAPDFFVLENCLLNGRLIRGKVLHLSYSGLLILESDELSALLRHEIYHLEKKEFNDLRLLKKGTILFTSFRDSPLPGSQKLARLFSHSFLLASARLSRAQERRADDEGRALGERSFSSALLKVCFLRFLWEKIEAEAIKKQEFNLTNLTRQFYEKKPLMESFVVRTLKASAHEYDTHPPLKERLRAISNYDVEFKSETSSNLFLQGQRIELLINDRWKKTLLKTHPVL